MIVYQETHGWELLKVRLGEKSYCNQGIGTILLLSIYECLVKMILEKQLLENLIKNHQKYSVPIIFDKNKLKGWRVSDGKEQKY